MSSSYPPQLHLTLPSNTTSFKRSFDQFGFDLESPVGNAEAGSSSGSPSSGSGSSRNGNKRQRPRSASSLSDGSDSLSSGSTFASGSSETRPSEASEPIAGPPALTSNRPISSNILGAMPFEPPRLPTPDIQDIEMPDYPLETQDETEDSDSESSSSGSSAEGAVLSSDEGYRSSHERLDDVERAPYGLLHPMPHIIPRPATPPPTLPPLALESDQTPLHQNVMPFLNDSSRSSSTLSNTTSDPGTLSSNTLHIPQASTSLPTESAISSHTLLTQDTVQYPVTDPATRTVVTGSHSDPDSISGSSLTSSRYTSFSDTLDQLLNHGELSSFSLEFRRPERTSSSRTRSSVASSGDVPTVLDHSLPTSTSSLLSATSFLRRHGSSNNSTLNSSESPWRHYPSSHEQDRDQFLASSHPTSNTDQSNLLAQRSSLSSSRDDPHTANGRPTSPFSFSYRFSPSSGARHGSVSSSTNIRHQLSSASLRSDLDRWFETPGSSNTASRDRFPPDRFRFSSHLTRNPSISIGVEEPSSRSYSNVVDPDRARRPDNDDLDFESTISGLRARMMENRRSVSESESHSHNSRTQRVPPTFTPLMARDTSDTLDSELHDLSGASRRSRYIEQGLVDPREAAGRHEIEDAQPPARWRFSWNDSFESEDQDDSRPLSDSERIYRISRGMARSSTRSLDDRHINNSSTRNLTVRRTRPRYSSALSGSTSLFSENAAEMRRRDDREVVDRLRRASTSGDYNSWELPSDDDPDSDSLRTTFGRGSTFTRADPSHREVVSRSPVLPPLSYQYRSPSPPSMPRAMTELLSQSEFPSRGSSRHALTSSSSRRDSPSRYLHPGSSSSDVFTTSLHTSTETPYDIHSRESGRNRNISFRMQPHYAADLGARSRRPTSHNEQYTPQTRNPRPSFDEPRRQSPAIFDSQSSTISDIARTITSHGYDLASSLYYPESPTTISNGAVDADMQVLSPEETFSPPANPPSIPPPDLGNNPFDSGDLSDISPPTRFPEVSVFQRYPVPPDRASTEVEQPSRPLRSPSPISPIEFAYHSPPPTSSIRRNQPDPDPAGLTGNRSGSIDLQSFAPGPYRNTLQRLVERGRLSDSSNPPSIPPLPFENPAPSLRASPTAANYSRERSFQAQIQVQNHRQPMGRRTSIPIPSARQSFSTRHPAEVNFTSSSQRRTSDDLHRHIMNHATFEASLLEGPEMPEAGHTSSELRGLDHALHVLRQDGLSEHRSQQLIERYRRQRQRQEPFEGNLNTGGISNPSSNAHNLWGSLEDNRASRRDNDRSGLGHRPFPRVHRGINMNPAGNGTSGAALDDDMGALVSLPAFPHRRRPASNSPTRHERTVMQDSRPAPFGRGRAFGTRFGRHRHHVDYEPEFVAFTDLIRRRAGARGAFSFGDFMRDEDFDGSYETLISLEAALGEVKPRATPDHVIAGLEAAFYKDWATKESDKRCPICLDDYKPLDQVLKLPECTHWLHKPCLEQWLKGASTCPVCRESVKAQPPSSPGPRSSTRPTRLLHSVFRNPIPGRNSTDALAENSSQVGSSNEMNIISDRGNENGTNSTPNGPPSRGRERFNRSSSSWRTAFRPPPDSGV